MSTRSYPHSFTIEPQSSRGLRRIFVMVPLLLLPSLLYLDLLLLAASLWLLAAAGWLHAWRGRPELAGSPVVVRWSELAWQWQGEGRTVALTLQPESVVTPWAVVLLWRDEGGGRHGLLLLPDMVDGEAFRRLRVALRRHYPGRDISPGSSRG